MASDSPSLGHFYSWLVLEGKEGFSVKRLDYSGSFIQGDEPGNYPRVLTCNEESALEEKVVH
jgi:hypothetical protein